MTAEPEIRLNNPPHPGQFVKVEIVDGIAGGVAEAAIALGVRRQTLYNLINETTALTSDMAIRIEKAFGVRMDTLMRMQNSYDIAQARQRADSIDVQPYKPAAAETKTDQLRLV